MTAEPLRALPRPAQSGRVSSPRPARLNRRSRAHARIGAHQAGTSVQPAGSGQPPAPSSRYGQFAFDDPFPSGRIWTRSGRAHPRAAITAVPKTREFQAKPSVGLEPTTPSLPWKGQGFTSVHGRSRTGTKSLQTAAIWSVRPWRPKYGRCGSSGRGVDALRLPEPGQISATRGSRERLPQGWDRAVESIAILSLDSGSDRAHGFADRAPRIGSGGPRTGLARCQEGVQLRLAYANAPLADAHMAQLATVEHVADGLLIQL